jgi:pyruvate carboxylase
VVLHKSSHLCYLHLQCPSVQVVNGPNHPGAVGPAPAKRTPPAPAVPAELRGQPLAGWREVYVKEGPEAWARAVRAHQGVLLTDTTM